MISGFDASSWQLKVGIEVHQQLGTPMKLFCHCPVIKSEELPLCFERRLRPSQSELGRIDPAAVFEYNKGKVNLYRWNPESSCLVEADEEPPHPINLDAVGTTLLISLMLGSSIVDEVHVMRKIVIDGSNTSGFQRTAVVGLGGRLSYGGKSVGVQSVTVEEDSARVLGEDVRSRQYALDRAGVPLVEIALDPISDSPEEVEAAALQLGRSLRSTGKVARGLGTIRQDLNVSVMGGGVVEVKGVQKLNLIAKVVRYEAARQVGLIKISEAIKERGISSVSCTTSDVTAVFKGAIGSGILKRILKSGGSVYCVNAEGMEGLIGFEPYPGIRLGKELAEIARTNSLGGVIHSDEFRKQGISEAEEEALRDAAGSRKGDALVLVAGDQGPALTVAVLVRERLEAAVAGAPRETRAATDEGETRFMRPRPGAARMYPETEIPEILVTPQWISRVSDSIPVPWEEKVNTFVTSYRLSRELALQVYDSNKADLFEGLAHEGLGLDNSVIASVVVELPIRLGREGADEDLLTGEVLAQTIRFIAHGLFAKEAAVDILRLVGTGKASTVESAASELGLSKSSMSDEELVTIIRNVLLKNKRLVEERGARAFSPIMGEVMKVVRGRVDGATVSRLIEREINPAQEKV